MVLGMSIQTFTLLHTAISLIAIVAGLVVVWGMLTGKRLPGWTAIFLLMTLLTSVTGFMFPVPLSPLLPSQITGIVALVVLAPTLAALYVFYLSGFWRPVYVIGAVISLYLNVFVLVVQVFQKVGFLHALAPTQSEPSFLITQVVVLIVFIVIGFIAVLRFRPAPALASV
jgi:hypothetical protein